MIKDIIEIILRKPNRKIFVLSMSIVGIAAAFLMNFISIPGLLQGELLYTETATLENLAFLILFTILSSVALTLQFGKGMRVTTKSKLGFLGMFAGVFTSACAVCSPYLLTALSIPTALTILPLGGFEIQLVSIGLILMSIYFSLKTATCTIKRH